jgi:long-chain acyl-CoA synthetase
MEQVEEIRAQIMADLPTRLYDAVRRWSVRTPDRFALVDSLGRWTYRELDTAVEGARTSLASSGIRPGDRVMIVCENCNAFVALFFALTEIGAWPVPVSSQLSAREIEVIRKHCGSRRTLYTAGVGLWALEHAKRDGARIEEFEELGTVGLGVLNEVAQPEPIEESTANSVAALVYTSGTTGNPKGVMLTHTNLLFAAKTSAQVRFVSSEDRVLGVLPVSHTTGMSIQFLGTLISGATLHFLTRFDPLKVRAAFEQESLTVLYGVPFLFTQFLEYARLRGMKSLRFPSLRLMSSSGAPLLPAVKSAVEALFGLPLQNGYGVTECAPVISISRVGAVPRGASVGTLYPGVEVKLVGQNQQEVPGGQVGEVWVRGPNIMKGYYRAPEETAAVIDSEGWFNTKDLGRFEDDNLFIVGRTKELIIRFGFNVYPVEVEGVLNELPGVVRSAVIGRTIDTGDQEIVAFVQLEADCNLSTAELMKHASQRLAPYKRPTEIRLIPKMPATHSGKVKKEELTKFLATETSVKQETDGKLD